MAGAKANLGGPGTAYVAGSIRIPATNEVEPS